MDKYQNLYKLLGYQFKDVELLDVALTHRSVSADHNERLEFLGDSVLNFVIADVLYKQFPEIREGILSRIRSSLVKGDTVAELANELSIGDYIKMSAGEKKSGGHNRASILENTLESITAAIYLDSDMATVHRVVHSWYEDRLMNVSPDESHKDPKTRLQEFLQAEKIPLPTYEIESTEGVAHDQTFYVSCKVEGLEFCTSGTGSSRRKAEQDAAEKYLECIKHPL